MITSWDDMPLECLLKIKTIAQLQLATEEEKNLRVAALLAGVDYDSILGIPLENVRELMDNTEFLLERRRRESMSLTGGPTPYSKTRWK